MADAQANHATKRLTRNMHEKQDNETIEKGIRS